MYQLDEDTTQDDELETLHVYVYKEKEKKPGLSPKLHTAIVVCVRLVIILIGIATFCLSPDQPASIETISVPAHFLPITQLKVRGTIVPTGSKTYPATYSKGMLTLYNGSILTQQLPAGFIVLSRSGVEIVTESSVSIPPGEPPSYGMATVPAHAAQPGQAGNVAAYTVSAVYGADVYIKNLATFSGGAEARTITYATEGDIDQTLVAARSMLSLQEHQQPGLLTAPCQEQTVQKALVLSVLWTCQFANFTPPPGAKVLSVRLDGRQVVLRVRWLGVA